MANAPETSALKGEKINRKRLEHLERMRKKNEAKNTKSKLKKLARIVERKKQKQTRDSLIEKLSQVHQTVFSDLIPTAKMHLKTHKEIRSSNENVKSSVKFPKRLRCVSGAPQNAATQQHRQDNYCDTGSSSSEEDDDSIQCMSPQTNNKNESTSSDIVQIADMGDAVYAEELEVKRAQRTVNSSKAKITLSQPDEINISADPKTTTSADFFVALERIKGTQIAVPRSETIEAQRRLLPIHAEEQEIVEAINDNTVILICGETGSGKTTQIPQFLYEAGYTSNGHLIGVTEPRRIAAISMAERVGNELCAPELSSYQIRFEGNKTEATRILFMTDGVLLRELQTDVTLSRFSVIVIDEAHERSVYSDVLIGLLSRICVTRLKRGFPLKLIIMSATLRLSDFLQERLFPKIKPKVIDVKTRQFEVKVHFSRRTPADYLKAAFRKVCKIHQQLPDGGILVFLSGQREVDQLIKWLSLRFPNKKEVKANTKKNPRKRKRDANMSPQFNARNSNEEDMVVDYEEFGAADAKYDDGPVNGEMPSDAEDDDSDEEFLDELYDSKGNFPSLHCLPLYSLLSSEKQRQVFEPVPSGSRLCVVATNVAETSLTIPNIRYVVDSGKEKRRHFDPVTGVSRFSVEWISRASADQRSGRAGRVRAGHTYRLYSSAVYEDFAKFTPPDILNQSIEQLVLHLKAMNFIKLLNFPFPTPPAADQIEAAEQKLLRLGALSREFEKSDTRITPLGKTLAQIPLSPPFAYMLARSNHSGLMPYAISIVATLSVREPLIAIAELRRDTAAATQDAMAKMLKQRRAWCALGEARHFGDLCVLLHLIGAADNEPKVNAKFLLDLGLRPKPYFEICRLRKQLISVVNESSSLSEKLGLDHKLLTPNQNQMHALREIMTASLPEQICKRVDRSANNATIPKGAYKCQKLEEFVFIDSTSVLYKEQPDYVIYQEIVQLGQKKCMQNIAAVEEDWIPEFVKQMLKNF